MDANGVWLGDVVNPRRSMPSAFCDANANDGLSAVARPDATRLLTLFSEACKLAISTAATGREGEVPALELRDHMRIPLMVLQFLRVSEQTDVEIVATGFPKVEAVFEALCGPERGQRATSHMTTDLPPVPLSGFEGVPASGMRWSKAGAGT